MKNILKTKKIKILYFIVAIISIGLSLIIRRNDDFDIFSIILTTLIAAILSFCNILILQRVLIIKMAKENAFNKIRLQSSIFTWIGILFYIFFLVISILDIDEDIFPIVILSPTYITIFLQNVIFINQETIIFFNKVYPLSNIKSIKVQKSIWNTYTINIFENTNKTPKTISINKKYLRKFLEEVEHRDINIELVKVDMTKLL